MNKLTRFPKEVRERAIRMVFEHNKSTEPREIHFSRLSFGP